MELSDLDCETLEHFEEELWREETRFDIHRMEEVLSVEVVIMTMRSAVAPQQEEPSQLR